MKVTIPPVTLICVGRIKDANCANLSAMYLKRLSHETKFTVNEIPDRGPVAEGKRITELLDKISGRSYALAEEGPLLTSREFAASLATETLPLTFIIGGPGGLSTPVKKAAGRLLSLSRFTFTHEIARVLLLEQLYRACSILNNRSYHRD